MEQLEANRIKGIYPGTEKEYLELSGPDNLDILNIRRMAGEITEKRIKQILRSAERGPSQAEAQMGPVDISLDPLLGFEKDPKLGTFSTAINTAIDLVEKMPGTGKVFSKTYRDPMIDGVIETAQRNKQTLTNQFESYSNVVGIFIRTHHPGVFQLDKWGNILDEALQNRVQMNFGGETLTLKSPKVQDVAAGIDEYWELLTDAQRKFMGDLYNIVENGTSWSAGDAHINMPGFNAVFRYKRERILHYQGRNKDTAR